MKFLNKAKKKEHELAKKFHEFAEIWREHAKEEVAVHRKMIGGHKNLRKHVKETIRIQKKFLAKLKKFA
ncbi:hypothetical protein H0O03_04870 [Candidatus Micrarchaeota archaeon]|nr:hypothetical protein [Candidatus Micrarchaeota archaeon]